MIDEVIAQVVGAAPAIAYRCAMPGFRTALVALLALSGLAGCAGRVDIEQLRPPSALVADASELLRRIDADVPESDRRSWLTGQVTALRTHAEGLAGSDLPYVELATRSFAWTPVRRDPAVFEQAAAEIDRLLPGPGPLADRLAAFNDGFILPVDRLTAIADWLVGLFRERAATTFGLPDDEAIRIKLVRNQPWTGYNWYEGGRRSRFDLNTDLPVRAAELLRVAAHEAYPGHHLEHAWREADLVDGRRRLEASILLINTPECLISEGLADLGHQFVSPEADEADLLIELYGRAGLAIADDAEAARDAAARTVAMDPHIRRLSEARVNAALMRHADRASHEAVLAWLERVGRYAPATAAKRLEFIEHPLWRTYVFVYHEGEALLRRWLDGVPDMERAARFERLFHEQLAPATIATELETGARATS